MDSVSPGSRIGCKTFYGEVMDIFRCFSSPEEVLGVDFSWTSGNSVFNWPMYNTDGWVKNSEIKKVDAFSRPRTSVNASNMIATAVYHPKLSGITGTISNAAFHESSVYTRDYDDANPVYPLYLDYNNGWEKKQSILTDEQKHL